MATFALPDLSIIANDVVGGIFTGLAIVNLVNLCRTPKEEVSK